MANLLDGVVCGNIGVGAIGSYMTRLQRRKGATVLLYDLNEARARQAAEEYGCEVVTLDELLANSDWISSAILPLRNVFGVMAQIGERRHLLKPGSVFVDHSGVKTGKKETLDVMLERGHTFKTAQLSAVEGRDDVEAGAIHLAFRPDVEPEGQNVYMSALKPARDGKWVPRIADFFKSFGANVYQMSPEQQDLVTLRHQMIPWMVMTIALDAVRKSGSDMSFKEIENLTTKFSKPLYELMKRMFSGNPTVYGDTIYHHPFALQAASLLRESISELSGRLVGGDSFKEWFNGLYIHLQAVTQSGSPENKTGKPMMVELFYESAAYQQVRQALGIEGLHSRHFHSTDIVVSMIDSGRINNLHIAGVPVAAFTTYKSRDKTQQPEIAFFVRNVSHPEHPERKGMRFSPIIPRDIKTAEQLNPNYARVQLNSLALDPVVNFFANIRQDPVLSSLQPFVVYKPL